MPCWLRWSICGTRLLGADAIVIELIEKNQTGSTTSASADFSSTTFQEETIVTAKLIKYKVADLP